MPFVVVVIYRTFEQEVLHMCIWEFTCFFVVVLVGSYIVRAFMFYAFASRERSTFFQNPGRGR